MFYVKYLLRFWVLADAVRGLLTNLCGGLGSVTRLLAVCGRIRFVGDLLGDNAWSKSSRSITSNERVGFRS